MADVELGIARLAGSGICVTSQDGQRVYEKIYEALKSGNRVKVSFFGVTRLTTAFLNAAVGQLYGEFSPEDIRRLMLPPADAEPWHLSRLKLVNDRAKQYFSDRGKYVEIIQSKLGVSLDDDN
ncbi:hypothetical protein RvVAR0630_21080 [Agrobacterium vitis]|uniref:STAS-like domain-containing protein n=1 Tax=Agrobacterium vitis TaxID=373 RepID=UPI0015D90A47|nr:STAS-like domain-containing protein [Agrobacterium vitis]BCH59484.1 hypothetical protein RvVAR0630_21080 [Agrobacterium vitis]